MGMYKEQEEAPTHLPHRGCLPCSESTCTGSWVALLRQLDPHGVYSEVSAPEMNGTPWGSDLTRSPALQFSVTSLHHRMQEPST